MPQSSIHRRAISRRVTATSVTAAVWITLLAGALCAAGCDDGSTTYSSATNGDENNEVNNTANNVDEPDAGEEPDGGDDEPDVGPPANGRTLGERPLMGDLPLNNHFADPTFKQLDGRFWLYYDTVRFQFSPIARDIVAESPTGTPLISDASQGVSGGALLLGLARAPEGAAYVSILVGNPSPLLESPVMSVGLIGTGLDGRDGYYPLRLTDEPAFQSGGVRWWRMETVIEEPLLGLVYLSVDGLRGGDYSLTAPTLIPADSMRSQRLRPDVAAPRAARALNRVEATAVEAARERLFRDPPPLDTEPRRDPNGVPF